MVNVVEQQNQVINLPLAFGARCVVCGSKFEQPAYRGRPKKFCGDICRRKQHTAQKLAWAARQQHTTEGKTECAPSEN